MRAISAHLVAAIVVGLSWSAGAAESPSTPAVQVNGTSGCGSPPAADLAAGRTVTREIASGGSKRSYVLHLPATYDPAKPTPLVLNFHGFGGGARRFAPSSREAHTAFVRDVAADVGAAPCVDGKRIFAAGKSQGAFMSSWLGCMAPDLIAAIAPVSGMYEPTAPCKPVPIDAHAQRVTYRQCRAETIQIITDAGHTWPGTHVREGDNTVPADLPASEPIWAFFKAHPKP
ncbi:MAG: hypothetical protein KGN16_17675 [Burkholderiales bacterium]|nr:hypothetical protein [Burkholderiales bacterium]